jgi:predicted amidohydrolase
MRVILIALFIITPLLVGSAQSKDVTVATVHFDPVLGDVAGNRSRLLGLDEEAAKAGAKIIVNTEMGTTGYAFFSRAQFGKVAEPIPGPTTHAFGQLAKKYRVYIAVGMAEVDPETQQYYNTVALIGPDGRVAGTYRKRNTLLEASYNAIVTGPVPVFETPYGKIAVVICADLFYPQFPRLAAVAGADILLAPANVGVDLSFLQQRAKENDLALVVANRYGTETKGSQIDEFDESTFTIASPFPYDFSYGSLSAIVGHDGTPIVEWDKPADHVLLGKIKVPTEHVFPVIRRPDLYSHLNQDTLEDYTFGELGLPAPLNATVGAADLGNGNHTVSDVDGMVQKAVRAASDQGKALKLLVFPMGSFSTDDASIVSGLADLAKRSGVDLVVPFDTAGSSRQPTSILFAVDGGAVAQYRYKRTHRLRNEKVIPGEHFTIVDRPYGRLSILQGSDLLAPETTMVMEKMGVDIVAVSAASADASSDVLWRTRAGDYLDLVVANSSGDEGVFLGGFPPSPTEKIGEGLVIFDTAIAHVRKKKEPRHVDTAPLLVGCAHSRC